MIALKLAPNWKAIATRAWSMWLMGLAALLSGIEVAISLYPEAFDFFGVPSGYAAIASGVVTFAAMIARLVAQQGVTTDG